MDTFRQQFMRALWMNLLLMFLLLIGIGHFDGLFYSFVVWRDSVFHFSF